MREVASEGGMRGIGVWGLRVKDDGGWLDVF